jgi:hypothetical protein
MILKSAFIGCWTRWVQKTWNGGLADVAGVRLMVNGTFRLLSTRPLWMARLKPKNGGSSARIAPERSNRTKRSQPSQAPWQSKVWIMSSSRRTPSSPILRGIGSSFVRRNTPDRGSSFGITRSLSAYLSRHPDVVLRLFSEALNLEGRLKAMETRFWNKLEFVTPKTLSDIWGARTDLQFEPA